MKYFIVMCLFFNIIASCQKNSSVSEHKIPQYEKNCIDKIIKTQKLLGNTEFSKKDFGSLANTSYKISSKKFNALPSDKQNHIYMQLKDTKFMINETIADIEGQIHTIENSVMAIFLADFINELKGAKEDLITCK